MRDANNLLIKMSLPALRQPKFTCIPQGKSNKSVVLDIKQYMILTLKDNKKIVVSSDAYHGIVMAGDSYKCVFCEVQMELDPVRKENHKNSASHGKQMVNYPHIDDFGENLIRKLQNDTFYCTICNVIVSALYVPRHITAEVHCQEQEKAAVRVAAYKPF